MLPDFMQMSIYRENAGLDFSTYVIVAVNLWFQVGNSTHDFEFLKGVA
jgi:hypothetical protein